MSSLSLEHIDPRSGVLVSGLENEFNEIIADFSYNSKKTNRFVPYRVCEYPAPINEGDIGEFLIDGEWVVCEFMVKYGTWWKESNRIGNSQVATGQANGPANLAKIPRERKVAGGKAAGPANLATIPRETLVANGQATGAANIANMPRETLVANGQANGRATGPANVVAMNNHENTLKQKRANSKITNNQRWQCLVTGHISSPGSLSVYQRARGIDTTLRVRVRD